MAIDPRAPVPLARAVSLFFPEGGVTVSTLRTEARKGRLALERIGGKDFVTGEAINQMRELCRVERKVRASTPEAAKAGASSGSSVTENTKRALAAARQAARELKENCRNT
jgi:hypothetical protein